MQPLPQRLSAGRKPRLPASWRATRPSPTRCISDHRRPPDTKQLFDKPGTATAPWQLLTSRRRVVRNLDRLGELRRLLCRVGGWPNGRAGSGVYARTKPLNPLMTAAANALLSGIHFSGEVSLVVGARAS
ncbi:hypothetical protein KCP75_01350 [Salmonella enterica subsp. enterica]|nr:hypothetical protein KCP75_01350 [Salmonella enterica subsp. enterica]